jgi:hypothetical protein
MKWCGDLGQASVVSAELPRVFDARNAQAIDQLVQLRCKLKQPRPRSRFCHFERSEKSLFGGQS